jgi:hypothetical protein
MRSSSDATERERHRRIAAALMEVAQALLTLHGLVRLDGQDMSGLVVQNITTLLDDAIDLERDASQHARLVWAIGEATEEFRTLTPVAIDALAASKRSQLYDAISNAMEAFKRLARAAEGCPDSALLDAVTEALQAVQDCSDALTHPGQQHTAMLSDRAHERLRVTSINGPYIRRIRRPERQRATPEDESRGRPDRIQRPHHSRGSMDRDER